MPRNGANVYSPPAGTYGVPGEVIESAPYNAYIDDITTDLNTARPISVGGTGATTAAQALINLGGLQVFASRAAFEAASPPLALAQWAVLHDDTLLRYVADATGTAITAANGLKGSPGETPRLEHWGAVGDGVTDNAAAILAACTSGVSLLEATQGKTYYFNSAVTISSVENLLIDLTGAEILQGEDANPGWQFVDCTDVSIAGGGSGLWTGNYDTAGAWESLVTSGGITDGDGTGSAAATYTGVSTITVNLLGTGYVKKGSRLSYIVSGTTYSYIVQADVQIIANTATNITLDRVLDVPLPSGGTVYINWYGRRMVLANAATAGATTLTLECGDVTSASGTPKMLAGDQFFLHGSNNDINDIDTGTVFEVDADATFSGSYPAKTVTVTLTAPIPSNIAKGVMITSIQDHRNNRFVPVLFYGCTRCGVTGMRLTKARLHGFVANACINAPWRGVAPSTKANSDMFFYDNYDDSTDGSGTSVVGARVNNMVIERCKGEYALGSTRNLASAERSTNVRFRNLDIYGGQYGVTINGECTDIEISGLTAVGARRPIRQANTSTKVRIFDWDITCDATYTDYGILVRAGIIGEDGESTGAGGRINDTFIGNGVVSGATRTAGGYGSHITVEEQANDSPYRVTITGTRSIGATMRGIDVRYGDTCEVWDNTVAQSGVEGIRALSCVDTIIERNTVIDAGEDTASAGVLVDGGTRIKVRHNRAMIDAGTGMTKGLTVSNSGQVIEEVGNDWLDTTPTTFGPGNGGAAEDGTTDDLAAYNLAFAAAPSEFRFLIEKPSNISGTVTRGGKEPLFETTGPMTWTSTTVFGRAVPGVVTNGQANIARKVFHANLNDTDGGTAVFVSARMGVSGATSSYQRNGLLSWVITEDPSTLNVDDDDTDPATNVAKGAVGLEGRGYIAASNATGKTWGGLLQARVLSGGDGSATGLEVGLFNEGTVVTDLASPIKKQGITVIAKTGEITSGLHIKKGSSGTGFVYGVLVGASALAGTNGTTAFEYQNYWRVTKAGAMFLAKTTAGAETEQGIELQQDGDSVFTKSSGIVSLKGVRASAMGAAGGVFNIDADAQTSAGTQRNIGRLAWYLSDHTDGSEDAELRISAITAGTLTQQVAIGDGVTVGAGLTMPGIGRINVKTQVQVNDTKVIGARITGWGAPTGTPTRTTFATGSVTLPQLAERVKALIDDLTTHGLIGT